MKKIFYILFIYVLIFTLTGCRVNDTIGNNVPISKEGFYFDTIIQISIYGMNKENAQKALDNCFKEAKTYENMLSATIEGSDISKINSNAPNKVLVSNQTIEILKIAKEYSKISEGAFDITMGRVTSLWDFSGKANLPDNAKLTEYSSYVDYTKINIEGNMVSLSEPNVSIDLGGIAKGYIADKMYESLVKDGVNSAFINLGGNVKVLGNKPDNSPIRVGIQNPNEESSDPILILTNVADKTVVTSGTYQRFFEIDGVRYHHILDTKTGMPVNNNLLSVSIITDESIKADALSTSVFLLGEEKGISLIESLKDTEAILIKNTGEIIYSSGAKSYIVD